jgi:glyoxylase-like metal-dependent hydrolase (beta-lactamase superfamily II)
MTNENTAKTNAEKAFFQNPPQEYMNFYSHEKVSDRTYVFTEGYSAENRFTIGVIVGDEKVLVIDAGLGMGGGFRAYIERVVGTEKPIICACTHGNVDHVGSAIEFDEAFLNSRDYYMLPGFGLHTPTRFGDLGAFSCDSPDVLYYAINHYTPNTETVFKDIDEGDVIDLGGIQIEPIRVPAHSPGSLAYFCRQEKICFVGDAIHIQTHIKRLDNDALIEYSKVIKRFISMVGDDCQLYSGHLAVPMSIQVAKNVAAACEEVAAGKTYGDPPTEMIFKNQKNRGDQQLRYHYVGNACIVYNATMIKLPE